MSAAYFVHYNSRTPCRRAVPSGTGRDVPKHKILTRDLKLNIVYVYIYRVASGCSLVQSSCWQLVEYHIHGPGITQHNA